MGGGRYSLPYSRLENVQFDGVHRDSTPGSVTYVCKHSNFFGLTLDRERTPQVYFGYQRVPPSTFDNQDHDKRTLRVIEGRKATDPTG